MSTNTGGSTSNTNDTPSSDSGSDSSTITSAGLGYGSALGIFVSIVAVVIIFMVFKSISGQPDIKTYLGYLASSYVGSSISKFIDFLPLIYIVLGFLLDSLNMEFQASKISLAAIGITAGQVILGTIMWGYQNLINRLFGGVNTLNSESIGELVSGFLDSCRINLLAFNVNPTNYGQTSNFSLLTFFIPACYLVALTFVNVNNPNQQYTPNYWVGPVVMLGLAIIGTLFRVLKPNNCDSGLTAINGILYAAIWTSIFMGIGYFVAPTILPYANKIFKYNSSVTGVSAGTKPNTAQSCASPQGDGVIYEIYQDGEMVGQV